MDRLGHVLDKVRDEYSDMACRVTDSQRMAGTALLLVTFVRCATCWHWLLASFALAHTCRQPLIAAGGLALTATWWVCSWFLPYWLVLAKNVPIILCMLLAFPRRRVSHSNSNSNSYSWPCFMCEDYKSKGTWERYLYMACLLAKFSCKPTADPLFDIINAFLQSMLLAENEEVMAGRAGDSNFHVDIATTILVTTGLEFTWNVHRVCYDYFQFSSQTSGCMAALAFAFVLCGYKADRHGNAIFALWQRMLIELCLAVMLFR